MYKKQRRGWLKHIDFILLDIILLQLSFMLAYMMRHGLSNPYQRPDYLNLAVVFLLIDFCIAIIFESFKNVLKRGYYKEGVAAVKHVFLVIGVTSFYIFTIQKGEDYSRGFFYLLIPTYLILTYIGRLLWKKYLKKKRASVMESSLIIMASKDRMAEVIENIRNNGFGIYAQMGAVVTDADCEGEIIGDVPVVANYADALEYIQREWVDEVFVESALEAGYPHELIDELNQMGVAVHYALERAGAHTENKRRIERFANYTVLTTSLNFATPMQLFLKRAMDIGGSLVGCVITLVIVVIFGPMIYISSPGPIFFAQERVGKNGKRFKMYKLRTMYLDAEERKAELMRENRVDSGLMFKLEYDPRIIGNRKLADGTIKKGLGSFLRESSLDEFPQMFNVLKGDMSLVGTRPPTCDEWEKYQSHHRARLAFRPGLTGMWQVSGRSNITDFEEVVKLDKKYIDEWDLGLDIKILLKTIGSVFGKKGAM